eukprot:2684-Heterococcus_DN1.PRE.1
MINSTQSTTAFCAVESPQDGSGRAGSMLQPMRSPPVETGTLVSSASAEGVPSTTQAMVQSGVVTDNALVGSNVLSLVDNSSYVSDGGTDRDVANATSDSDNSSDATDDNVYEPARRPSSRASDLTLSSSNSIMHRSLGNGVSVPVMRGAQDGVVAVLNGSGSIRDISGGNVSTNRGVSPPMTLPRTGTTTAIMLICGVLTAASICLHALNTHMMNRTGSHDRVHLSDGRASVIDILAQATVDSISTINRDLITDGVSSVNDTSDDGSTRDTGKLGNILLTKDSTAAHDALSGDGLEATATPTARALEPHSRFTLVMEAQKVDQLTTDNIKLRSELNVLGDSKEALVNANVAL